MDDIYCCNSFILAVTVFSLPILIEKTTAIKKAVNADAASQNFSYFTKLSSLGMLE